jgi:hypothetical protein
MTFLFLRAFAGLLAFDLHGFGHNFAALHRFVSSRPVSAQVACRDIVERVCEAVNNACIWYPKRVLCLQRSAVITCLLRDFGSPAKFVLGAQSLPFKAHAWTEVDGRAVNERRDVQRIYSVLERC